MGLMKRDIGLGESSIPQFLIKLDNDIKKSTFVSDEISSVNIKILPLYPTIPEFILSNPKEKKR
jgi:hypothetical protein